MEPNKPHLQHIKPCSLHSQPCCSDLWALDSSFSGRVTLPRTLHVLHESVIQKSENLWLLMGAVSPFLTLSAPGPTVLTSTKNFVAGGPGRPGGPGGPGGPSLPCGPAGPGGPCIPTEPLSPCRAIQRAEQQTLTVDTGSPQCSWLLDDLWSRRPR